MAWETLVDREAYGMNMMQVPSPAPPPPLLGIDPTFLLNQLMPIVALIVVFVGLRWVFRTPVGAAIADAIRAEIHRRRRWKGFGGEWVDAPGEGLGDDRRVAALEEQVSTLQGQLSELAERVDFAERMLAERRGRKIGPGPRRGPPPPADSLGGFCTLLA